MKFWTHCTLEGGFWTQKKSRHTSYSIKIQPVLNMLPNTLQEILKRQCWYANPMCTDLYGTRFNDLMNNFDKYQAFLDACGHDTHELAGAVARTKAAIQELKHVNERMTDQFKQDPFPFMNGVDGGRIKKEDAVVEEVAVSSVDNSILLH